MTRVVTATYRLQLHREFPLNAARELVPYFHKLGVSHLYLSPITVATPGSAHGYDVADPTRLNPELGTDDDLRALATELHERGMGIILDVVPNHMAASEHNPYWDNVLERGRESRFASWFDIEWSAPRARGRVVLPVLGDDLDRVLERDEITLRIRDSGARVACFGKTFPLDPSTLPKEFQLAQWDPSGRPAAEDWVAGPDGRQRLRTLLDAQHYKLTFWRRTADINYRRFFDIDALVGVRVEDESVFDATHRAVLQWIRDGVLDGLRIDHVDGLREPGAYLARLRAEVDAARHQDAPERIPIVVEKILLGDERLPGEWPVEGTTGYDFMTDIEDLFLDPGGSAAIEAAYRGLRHNPSLRFAAIAREGKRRALEGALRPDVLRVARLVREWGGDAAPPVKDVADAVVEFLVHTSVYRTYVVEPGVVSDEDRAIIAGAVRQARTAGANPDAVRLVERAFLGTADPADTLRRDIVLRLQQTSGPATAKGVEDTALYQYVPLASRNEVGGAPDRPLADAHDRVHRRNRERAFDWPRTLLATDTHDTKRSADVRARLDVLTTMPATWARHVGRWRRLNKPHRTVVRGKLTPDTNSEYLYYQTLFGLWPAQRPERRADDIPAPEWLENASERLTAYMRKAVREAKTLTSWTETDPVYEKALLGFVRATLSPREESHFLPDIARLTAASALPAFRLSLSRVLLHCTAPGIPDLYQGNEFWNFTLVDPDNRRAVDFEQRRRALDALDNPEALQRALSAARPFEPQAKLALLARLLQFRRTHPQLTTRGDYLALRVAGAGVAESIGAPVFAFARRWNDQAMLAVACTHDRAGVGEDLHIELPDALAGTWESVLTGQLADLVHTSSGTMLRAGELFGEHRSCDLLFRRQG